MVFAYISIIVISYKSEGFIEKCIKCIRSSYPYEIIIVDNDDNQKVLERIKAAYPKQVKVIPYTQNLGFSEGNNKGIRVAEGEYIMTLNADCFLEKDYIDECLRFMEKNQRYSSVQGKLILANNKKLIDSTGHIMTRSGFSIDRDHQEKDNKINGRESGDVFGVCAAAAIYRRKALEDTAIKIQGTNVIREFFDNDFFAVLEDADLDYRLQLKGWNSYYNNKAVAYHIREATTEHAFRFKQALRNKCYLMIKNSTKARMLSNLVLCILILLFLPEKKQNYSTIARMLKKRKIIQESKIMTQKSIAKKMVLTPYFYWMKRLFKRYSR
ncbi:glycosyltransferase [Candidatus Woesearchaeota archaeon]|nr:glycosyltransferase [Candidatus Woesearchaeota archaeon]